MRGAVAIPAGVNGQVATQLRSCTIPIRHTDAFVPGAKMQLLGPLRDLVPSMPTTTQGSSVGSISRLPRSKACTLMDGNHEPRGVVVP